jgi:hypothetical protein
MSASAVAPPSIDPRTRFRRLGREVVIEPDSLALHRCRVRAALQLPGNEPAQGALADLMFGCQSEPAEVRLSAIDVAARRLPERTTDQFRLQVRQRHFPASSRLATRWSVLVQASLDIPARALRVSSDDSRQLAMAAVTAWHAGDDAAQLAFLDHCLVCHDTLAFMMARRFLLRRSASLPARWVSVSHRLQDAGLEA